jgi:hypothetical protein
VSFRLWRPDGDSNPGYRRESAVTWTCKDVTGLQTAYFP